MAVKKIRLNRLGRLQPYSRDFLRELRFLSRKSILTNVHSAPKSFQLKQRGYSLPHAKMSRLETKQSIVFSIYLDEKTSGSSVRNSQQKRYPGMEFYAQFHGSIGLFCAAKTQGQGLWVYKNGQIC